jgi:hypothetical protein
VYSVFRCLNTVGLLNLTALFNAFSNRIFIWQHLHSTFSIWQIAQWMRSVWLWVFSIAIMSTSILKFWNAQRNDVKWFWMFYQSVLISKKKTISIFKIQYKNSFTWIYFFSLMVENNCSIIICLPKFRFCSRQLWIVWIFRIFARIVGVFYELCVLLMKFNEIRELLTKFHELREFWRLTNDMHRFPIDFSRL